MPHFIVTAEDRFGMVQTYETETQADAESWAAQAVEQGDSVSFYECPDDRTRQAVWDNVILTGEFRNHYVKESTQ